ncbi:GIY-YIG nuclease family protein [Sphingomonas sp. BGYR3]|uniref:GIY-YIG nuclease family protein n=1 Tax=Sphingomonas sp. BGYR3 TaxID=2975483 RepID=UPI0021A8CBED|nr:GIY-YIG nuclease family protein [Sphingomonas sp. BGYR3]MDG5489442.1 GIY-YIG nuclease family protein [Sphingomonas sp. BGYR3]
MSDTQFGRTIQLFLVNGTPNGLRKATIHGWTGLTFVATDSTFGALLARPELDRTGIYILHGPDPQRQGGTRAYIGSANSVVERIKQSAGQRGFWETAIAVTTSDDDLSKGHVEYLEARLIEMAASAKRVELDNGTQPSGSRRRLPEADQANMEQFLLNLQVILPVIGLDLLKPQPKAAVQILAPLEQRTYGEIKFEIRHKAGAAADAVEEDGEFIVLEGSLALKDSGFQSNTYSTLRASLIAKGLLQDNGEGLYRFNAPFSFNSPSAAAAVVLDRNANGRTEWKLKGTKRTYAEWKIAQSDPELQIVIPDNVY